MKKIIGVLICMLLISIVIPASGINNSYLNEIIFENEENKNSFHYKPETYLLTTEWGQWKYYNEECPIDPDTGKPHRLGCWSVAIGQILRFHEVQSHGYVDYFYQNKDGDYIYLENDLNDFEYDWDHMADWLNGSHTPEQEEHVSNLLYDTATVIQKNFGHDNYMKNSSEMVEEIIDHFQYISAQSEVKNLPSPDEIMDEINHSRPCMLYLEKISGGGHAVVIDGWRIRRDFEVHLNFGWNGNNNSWYVYDEPILDYDDNNMRRVIFIRLSPSKPQKPIGPITGTPGVEQDFTTTTTVKNGLPIYYRWDWDDGTYSDWMGRYESGETCKASHIWKDIGKYSVRVKARDANGWESPWSDPHAIEMPRYKFVIRPILQIFQRCPILLTILKSNIFY